jgi:hypothetical protein
LGIKETFHQKSPLGVALVLVSKTSSPLAGEDKGGGAVSKALIMLSFTASISLRTSLFQNLNTVNPAFSGIDHALRREQIVQNDARHLFRRLSAFRNRQNQRYSCRLAVACEI